MARRRALDAGTYVGGLLASSRNLLVPHYLIHSWLYYELDRPLVSDALYDSITRRLAAEWDGIEHPHKIIVQREALSAGTGYYLSGKYPSIVPHAAFALARTLGRKW